MTEAQGKPIHQQFKEEFEDLTRRANAFRSQHMSPANVERHCAEFEKQWTEKLENAQLKHCSEPMRDAVDAVRADTKPDLDFADEKNMRPQLKLSPEATRRMAQGRSRGDNERDF